MALWRVAMRVKAGAAAAAAAAAIAAAASSIFLPHLLALLEHARHPVVIRLLVGQLHAQSMLRDQARLAQPVRRVADSGERVVKGGVTTYANLDGSTFTREFGALFGSGPRRMRAPHRANATARDRG